MCQFVPNFLSYVFAKYIWQKVGKVIPENKKGKHLLRHSVYVYATTGTVFLSCYVFALYFV